MNTSYPRTLKLVEETPEIIRVTSTTTLKENTINPFAIESVSLFFTPQNLPIIAEEMWRMVADLAPDYIIGVASSGIPVAMALAEQAKKPWFYLKPIGKPEKVDELNQLDLIKNKRVIMVDDLAAKGFTKEQLYKNVKNKVKVVGIATVVEWRKLCNIARSSWAKETEIRSMFALEDLVDHLNSVGKLSDEATELISFWLAAEPGTFNTPSMVEKIKNYLNKYQLKAGDSAR